MARLASFTIALFFVLAPVAFGEGIGEGWYGESNDKAITNAGFILIAFFPLFALFASLVQWRLDKRKDQRKAAAKEREARPEWRGGW